MRAIELDLKESNQERLPALVIDGRAGPRRPKWDTSEKRNKFLARIFDHADGFSKPAIKMLE